MLWISIILVATSAHMLIPHTELNRGLVVDSNWLWVYLISIVSAFMHFYKQPTVRLDKKFLVFLILFFLALIYLPSILAIPIIVSMASIVALSIPNRNQRLMGAIGVSLLFASSLLCVLYMLTPLYLRFEASNHDIPFVAPVVKTTMEYLGSEGWVNNGILVLNKFGSESRLSLTIEKFAGYQFVCIFVCAAIILAILKGKNCIRSLLIITVTLIAYSIFRFIFVAFLYLSSPDIAFWWDTYITAVTIIPVAIILNLVLPLSKYNISNDISQIRINARLLFKPALIGIALPIVFIGAFIFEYPGTQKQGRIIIDEGHSHWEWTTEELNRNVYGTKTVYNYYCLKKLLSHFFDSATSNYDRLSSNVLANCDVLILKTPTEPYGQEETEAVRDFVMRGGGLWLIGDHTNIFGMNTHLNQIAQFFGIYFNPDAVTAMPQGRQLWQPWEALSHPISHLMPTFLFATSDSLRINRKVKSVILGTSLLSDNPDYSTNAFFGDLVCGGDERFGAFIQGAATKYGKGRVAAFTDSTVFSNFTMFMPGKPTLALCTVNWLNKTNRQTYIGLVCKLLILILFYLWLLSLSGLERTHIIFAVTFCILFGTVVAAAYCHWQNKMFYPLPKERIPYTSIAFERKHCSYHLPILSRTKDVMHNSFKTFYVWTQRIGAFPCVKDNIQRACNGSQAVVFIRPVKAFSEQELNILKTYVHNGGNLLIIGYPGNKRSTVEQLLSAFDFSVYKPKHHVIPKKLIWQNGQIKGIDEIKPAINYNNKAFHIRGGEKLLVSDLNQTVISNRSYGNGLVVACTAEYIFTDIMMGLTSAKPTKEKWVIWNIMYSIFDMFLERDSKGISNVEDENHKGTRSS